MHDSAWSKDLTVEVAGHGVVSHTGSAVLRLIADNTGLTAGLSRALARRGFAPVRDCGWLLGRWCTGRNWLRRLIQLLFLCLRDCCCAW